MSNDILRLEDLVSSYRAYAEADDLKVAASVDAPASTPYCGGITPGIAFTVWACDYQERRGRSC